MSFKLLSSSLPFLDQPILPSVCGMGTLCPGGVMLLFPSFPAARPSAPQGSEVRFNSWMGLASSGQQKG